MVGESVIVSLAGGQMHVLPDVHERLKLDFPLSVRSVHHYR